MCLQKLIDRFIVIKPWPILGGNCGLCGAWVPLAEVDPDWPWTICERCIEEEEEGGEVG